jgi:hypothetical protein
MPMTSNVARLIHIATSIFSPLYSATPSPLPSRSTSARTPASSTSSTQRSRSCVPFLNTSGTSARRFWGENAGLATRRWRRCVAPSAASMPQPMRPVMRLRDCHGFS